MSSTSLHAEPASFFDEIQHGQYVCSTAPCEIEEMREIIVDQPHTYSMLILSDVSGFVESITARDDKRYEVDMNWDDGSGRSNYETIHVQVLDEESFLLTDSKGRRNLMKFSYAD